ncbi:MAG: hypothetical protein AAB451_02250 [Patescibacteria group bacterium]
MLTIFSSPRPFKNEFDLIQRNAIQSWLSVCPDCEIILIGDEEGTAETASEFKIKYISDVKKNEKGVILRNSIFQEARKAAQNKLLCFINTDIILTGDFLKVIQSVRLPSFLLSGQRWDLNIKEPINFTNSAWQEKLRQQIKIDGKLHGLSAGDYFIFSRDVQPDMFPFSIKHGGWDNSFIYQFKKLGIPVIDATEIITVIHQNHERRQLKKSIWKEEEGKRELRLAGGFSNMCTMREADWILTAEGLKKPQFTRQIFSKLALFYPWRLILSFKRRLLS